MTTSDVAARVQRGAAWLDKHRPGWVGRINLDELRVEEPCNCILGQLDGDFYETPISGLEAVDMGFDVVSFWEREELAALDEAWCALIEQRRGEGYR